ncbi:MAG: hypothetical protein OHK0046_21120 [Anaerolineae bacterium]
MVHRFLIVLLLLLAMGSGVLAQGDGRVDPRDGDRVIVFCKSTKLEVWGASDLGIGLFLTSVSYDSLIANNAITQNTSQGQVIIFVDAHGNFSVRWIGGAAQATGVGDFRKSFTCPFAVPINVAPAVIPPALPETTVPTTTTTSTTTVRLEQSATVQQTGVTVNQSVLINTTVPATLTCGSNRYVVRTGDNLFRIAIRYGTTVSALAACNGIADPSRIYVGQELRVP